MTTYNIYQVHMNRAKFNTLDAHLEIHGNYPEWFKHYRENQCDPTNETINNLKEKFELVAMIDARDLEHCFQISNVGNQEHRVTRFSPMHSLSVGDLLRDENDVYWVCDNHGFKKVEIKLN